MEETFNNQELFSKFKQRLESRHIIYDDIYLDTVLISYIISHNRRLYPNYDFWLRNLCNLSLFNTCEGNIRFIDIQRLTIEFSNVYVLSGDKKYHVLSPKSKDKPLIVNSIKDIELQITANLISHMKEKRKDLIALPDLTIIIKEMCGDMSIKTTYESTKAIKKALLGNDETEELLKRMSYELFLDLQVIFNDVPIYWGKK